MLRGNSQSLEADWEGSLLEGLCSPSLLHEVLMTMHACDHARIIACWAVLLCNRSSVSAVCSTSPNSVPAGNMTFLIWALS